MRSALEKMLTGILYLEAKDTTTTKTQEIISLLEQMYQWEIENNQIFFIDANNILIKFLKVEAILIPSLYLQRYAFRIIIIISYQASKVHNRRRTKEHNHESPGKHEY